MWVNGWVNVWVYSVCASPSLASNTVFLLAIQYKKSKIVIDSLAPESQTDDYSLLQHCWVWVDAKGHEGQNISRSSGSMAAGRK